MNAEANRFNPDSQDIDITPESLGNKRSLVFARRLAAEVQALADLHEELVYEIQKNPNVEPDPQTVRHLKQVEPALNSAWQEQQSLGNGTKQTEK